MREIWAEHFCNDGTVITVNWLLRVMLQKEINWTIKTRVWGERGDGDSLINMQFCATGINILIQKLYYSFCLSKMDQIEKKNILYNKNLFPCGSFDELLIMLDTRRKTFLRYYESSCIRWVGSFYLKLETGLGWYKTRFSIKYSSNCFRLKRAGSWG